MANKKIEPSQISFRISPAFKAKLELMADKHNMSLNEFLGRAVNYSVYIAEKSDEDTQVIIHNPKGLKDKDLILQPLFGNV